MEVNVGDEQVDSAGRRVRLKLIVKIKDGVLV